MQHKTPCLHLILYFICLSESIGSKVFTFSDPSQFALICGYTDKRNGQEKNLILFQRRRRRKKKKKSGEAILYSLYPLSVSQSENSKQLKGQSRRSTDGWDGMGWDGWDGWMGWMDGWDRDRDRGRERAEESKCVKKWTEKGFFVFRGPRQKETPSKEESANTYTIQ